MRSQLRLRVLLPVAVLGLLAAGFGAFTLNGSAAEESAPASTARPAKTSAAPKAAPAKKASKPSRKVKTLTPLERALKEHRTVVVVLYTPDASLDALTTLEARAGAEDARVGFLAIDVSKKQSVEALAEKHALRSAPGILVVTRGPKVAARFDGFADRETIAQAAFNAFA